MGFKTNPTDVRAIAPAIRFPGTDNLTSADPFGFVVDEEGVESLEIVWNCVR